MPRAVLRNGLIHPLDPLPAEWHEGQELRVESAAPEHSEPSAEASDREFWQTCPDDDPADLERLGHALAEAKRLAKEQVRHSMGLD